MSDPMQPHPEELLAEYVDDPAVLAPEDRSAVESHLASCSRCREDVALATRGRGAMSLLEEVPVPLGVTGPVLSKVRTERPWLSRAARPFAAVAAAAVIAVAGFTVLSSLGGSSDEAGSGGAGEAEDSADRTAAESALQMEVYDEDFSNEDLDALAAQAAGEAKVDASSAPAEDGGGGQAPQSSLVAPPRAVTASPVELSDPSSALECLGRTAELKPDDRPARVISARFNGTPAYIGFYLRSPGAGQPADRLLVWVVDADSCQLLSFATRKI